MLASTSFPPHNQQKGTNKQKTMNDENKNVKIIPEEQQRRRGSE